MRNLILSLKLLVFCALPATALSQDTAPENESIQLENIIVPGQSIEETLPQRIAEYGSRLDIIEADAIRAAGTTDIARTLALLAPGLSVRAKNGSFDYVTASLQGSRSQDILWLVDGVRINNRLYAGTSPLDTIPASITERIEILKGGQGLFYGTQAVSGVVNIITRTPSEEDQGLLSFGIHSHEGRNISGYQSGGDKRQQYLIFGDYSRAKGFQPYNDSDFEDSATDRRRSYDNLTMGGKYRISFSEDHSLSLFYQRNEAKLDFARPVDNFLTENNRKEDLAYIRLDNQFGKHLKLQTKAYYHKWDTRYLRLFNDPANPDNLIVRNDNDFWGYEDTGLNITAEVLNTPLFEYTAGYDFQMFNGKDDVLLIGKKSENVHAIFAQVATSPELLSDTRISAGVRYNKPSGDGDKLVGQLNLLHWFSPSTFLRAGSGTSFRLPSAYELYAIDPCCTQGNSDLRPETAINHNLAVGQDAADFKWELSGFFRRVDNLIQSEDQGNQRVFGNTSNYVDFRGAELNTEVQLTEQLSGGFNYVYTSANEKDESKQINNIPLEEAKVNLTYKPAQSPFRFTISGVFTGDIYDVENGERINYGEYAYFDASAEYRFGKNEKQSLQLTLENLTDKEYATSLGTAQRDADDSDYVYRNLGTPFTAHLRYDYRF